MSAAEAAPFSRTVTFQAMAVLTVVTAGWTILGLRLRHGRKWPRSMPVAGALLVVHMLVLWLVVWRYQPLGSEAFFDDQSGLLENRPSWHAATLASFTVLSAAWSIAALLGLLRRPRMTDVATETGSSVNAA